MLTDAAQLYSAVFAPELFVLVCGALLIGYEWRDAPAPGWRGLAARLGLLAIGWVIAFAVYQGVPMLLETVPTWGPDATGSAGLAIGMVVVGAGWRARGCGDLVPEFAALLVVITVPHLLITPFWDVSSHVLYVVVPAGYLLFVDDRFVALSAVGIGMVFARPLAGAHTWPQSLGGLVLSIALLAAFRRVRTG